MTPRSETLESPTGPSGAGSRDAAERPARRNVRAVPVLFGALLVAVLALAVSPGLRRQLVQSFARQDQHYVELYFADETAARTCPAGQDGSVRLDARVRSHLADAARLDWTATIASTAPATPDRVEGAISTRPGTTSRLIAQFPASDIPRDAYTVTIALTGRDERLSLHC